MNRRQVLLGCTAVISCIYAAVFYFVFSYGKDEPETVLLQNDQIQQVDTLYWLQAGVFKEKTSYELLEKNLTEAGFDVYCVSKEELTVVLLEPKTTYEDLKKCMIDAMQAGFEVIEKQAKLNEDQAELVESKQFQAVFEELMSQ